MARELIPFDKLFSKERRANYHARIDALQDGKRSGHMDGSVQPATDGVKKLSFADDPLENRVAERKMVSIRADIKESAGGKFGVWVIDLSKTGFRIKLLTSLERNKTQFLLLPGFQPLASHIAWRENDEYGMRFDKPLHISVFEHIARSFPGIAGAAH